MSLLRRRVPGILPGACLALLCIYTCQKAAPVKVPPKNNATLVSAELPSALEPRQRVAVAVVMRNDGETTWSSEAFKLSAVGSDAAVWAASGFPWALPAGAAVAPGETVRFSFTLVAPDEEKDAHLMLQMQHGDAGVFGATTDYVVSVRGRNYASQPFFIALAQKVPLEEDGGGIFAHDLTGDGRMDFVVTSGDEVGAYEHNGNVLWVATPGVAGTHSDDLQGAHNPGAIAGDMDGDGECEVAYLIEGGFLRILNGRTGVEKKRIAAGAAKAVAIANLRGLGDRDAVLQDNQTTLRAIRLDTGEALWTTTSFRGIDSRPVRQADLDGDGRDELCGSNIIGADGKQRHDFDLPTVRPGFNWRDVDSLVIGDVIPGGSLEVAIAEQSGNDEALVFGLNGLIYGVANAGDPCCALCDECREPDPDKVALGNFTGDDALEFFARSACGRAPWVIDSQGKIIAAWTVDSKKPAGWTQAGIEEVVAIDWYGDTYQSLLAKERHMAGAVAVIDALTGQFRMTIAASAARAYAADVAGDYREEIVILDMDGRIKIYWNDAPRIVPRPGYWRLSQYRRQKQNWNYYSP